MKTKAREEIEVADKLLLRPEEVAELISMGRTKVYELMKTGELESVQIGSSRRVPATAIAEYVGRLRDNSTENRNSSDIVARQRTVPR